MRQIGLAGVLAVSLCLAPLAAGAQQRGKIYHVGFLTLGAHPDQHGMWQKLLEALRALNYVEGQNLTLKIAAAEGKPERLPGLVAELIQAKVDLIVTTSTQETLATKKATSTIPIVMTLVPDPVEQGLVASLARPGNNVTGLTTLAPGTSQKLVELLREVAPSATRLGVLRTGANSPFPAIGRELEVAAQQTGITLSYIGGIERPDDFERALGAFTYRYRPALVRAASKHRLPGIYWVRDFVEEGGLMSYGVSFGEVGRRAAYFVDRLLQGAKPADLPVEQPTKFELVINLKTAKALGLTIPQSVLLRADHVIE
jgi:putative ABC transport system substrate-binding protein